MNLLLPTRRPVAPLSRRYLPLAVALAGLVSASSPAQAAEIIWSLPGPGAGLFGTPGNWNTGVVPGANDFASVNNGGIAQIIAGDNFTVKESWAGNGTAGKFQQTGGTLNVTDWFVVGRGGSAGDYELSGGSVVKTGGGHSLVGDGGGSQGHMAISNGGTFTMTGGQFWVGQGGNGILDVLSGGTMVLNDWLAIGREGGTGLINLNGGTITKNTGGNITFTGAGGTLNQTAGTLTNTASETWIAEGGTSEWKMSGGTANIGFLAVGRSGNGAGTLTVSGSAALTATNVSVGQFDSVKGTLTMNGGSMTAQTITMGSNTTTQSTLNLNGGTLSVNNLAPGGSTGARAVNFNGGVLRANVDSPSFLGGFSGNQLNLQAGGATLDTNGKAVGLSSAMTGAGGLTKTGAGVLTLNAAQAYTGSTVISGGTVRMSTAVAPNTTYNLPTGTVAYYAFHGGSGANLLHDFSGNNNDLKIAQGNVVPGASTPSGGGSITLSGNAFLDPVSGTFPTGVPTGNSAYTIGLWVNLNNGGNNGFVGWGNYGNNGQVNAFRSAGGAGLSHYWWAADITPGTPTSMQNNWAYVAATFDPGTNTRRVFFNGNQIAIDNPGIVHGTTAANFRVGSTNFGEFFGGSMSDLLITNTAMTQAQIQAAQAGFATSFVGKTDLLPTNTKLQIGGSGTFDLFSGQQTVGSLADSGGSGGIVTNGGTNGASTLRVGSDGTSTIFSGSIQNGAGTTALTKFGPGTLTLSGATNTYSGPTSVEGGTLRVDGAVTVSSVSVKAGTLAGTGTLGGPVVVGDGLGAGDAILSPGADGLIESLNTGALTLASDATLRLDLNIVGGPTVTSDLVIVGGALGIAADTALEIVPLGAGNVLTQGTSFTIVDYAGAWNGGIFDLGVGGTALPDQAIFNIGANAFQIDYNAPGDNVTLTVVPEPASLTSLLGGLALLLTRRRRRA